jgi:hypothetical protein
VNLGLGSGGSMIHTEMMSLRHIASRALYLPSRGVHAGDLEPARNQIARDRHAGATAEIEHMSARRQEMGELIQLACTHRRVTELLKVAVGDLIVSSRDELCDLTAAQSPVLAFLGV